MFKLITHDNTTLKSAFIEIEQIMDEKQGEKLFKKINEFKEFLIECKKTVFWSGISYDDDGHSSNPEVIEFIYMNMVGDMDSYWEINGNTEFIYDFLKETSYISNVYQGLVTPNYLYKDIKCTWISFNIDFFAFQKYKEALARRII